LSQLHSYNKKLTEVTAGKNQETSKLSNHVNTCSQRWYQQNKYS